MIGIMMIKDEADMLEEALHNHSLFCDQIFVLDGTTGPLQKRSHDICRSFPKVAGYWQDAETNITQPLRDGARGFLLSKAREALGTGHWYAVLHGDEIWSSDPRHLVLDCPEDADACSIRLYHFFPHISQRDVWNYVPFETRIEACATHFMLPGITENRLFLDKGSFDYDINRHGRVIPMGMRIWRTDFAIKQYNYRTPDQAHMRALSRRDDGWQRNHYQHLIEDTDKFFLETLTNTTNKWASTVQIGEGTVTNIHEHRLPGYRPAVSAT